MLDIAIYKRPVNTVRQGDGIFLVNVDGVSGLCLLRSHGNRGGHKSASVCMQKRGYRVWIAATLPIPLERHHVHPVVYVHKDSFKMDLQAAMFMHTRCYVPRPKVIILHRPVLVNKSRHVLCCEYKPMRDSKTIPKHTALLVNMSRYLDIKHSISANNVVKMAYRPL